MTDNQEQLGSVDQIVSRSKSNFSSSFFFLPRENRLAISRVYAFFRVIDDVVDEEPLRNRQIEMIALWKNYLAQSYQGNPPNPLLVDLMESVRRFDIPQEYFIKLIEGCEMDITKQRYNTFEELYEYCYRVASMVGLVCMKIFEYKSPTSEKTAIDLGLALQLTNIIRDVGVDAGKGRVYLPQEDLKKFGVDENDFFKKTESENFYQLMDFQYGRAIDYYRSGFSEFQTDRHNKLLAAHIMGLVYLKILKKIRAQKYPVLHRKVKLGFAEKMIVLSEVLIRHYLKWPEKI